MTDRENLVEILGEFLLWPTKMKDVWMPKGIEKLADHLIANGVAVQGWISVKDRLPGDGTTVNLYTRSRIVGTGFYDKHTKSWVQYYSGGAICVDVTHWQPMPQPPKGE